MPSDDGRDLIIVSDLHMSAGYNRRTGTYDRNEDFFYDAAFSRFIDNLILRAPAEQRRWRLLVMGDLVDFLQVSVKDRTAGLTSSADALAKLDVIVAGHAELFAALGRFLAAGHALDVLIGNHDIEFIWPDVQERFKQLIAQHVPADASPPPITFHPWIFYIPRLVYAEHGQQYDTLNSFTTLMRPFLPSDPTLIELPLGSFFVLYLFNQIERIDPFADNIKPVTRYLAWAFRAHPVTGLSILGFHVRFFIRVLRKTSDLSADQQAARRESYRREVVRTSAAQIGLPADTLQAIDELAAIPALSSRWRQLRVLLLDPLFPSVPLLAAIVAIYQGAKRLRPGLRSFVSIMTGIGALVWRERRLLRPATQSGSYLWAAAQRIHAHLQAADAAVPVYVFGHTHTAEQSPLTPDDETPRYFNTGTWTPLVPQAFDLLTTRERFSFVQITRHATTGELRAALLIWNDAANRAEPLPMLM